jgi:hypothetical protein
MKHSYKHKEPLPSFNFGDIRENKYTNDPVELLKYLLSGFGIMVGLSFLFFSDMINRYFSFLGLDDGVFKVIGFLLAFFCADFSILILKRSRS